MDYRYNYPVLIGDLRGVDVRIGMDFMIDFRVKLDLAEMTMNLDPRQVVNVHIACQRAYG